MAQITSLRVVNRPIRVTCKTVADVSYNSQFFSMWVRSAGQEYGFGTPANLQLDNRTAKQLIKILSDFCTKFDNQTK